MPSRESCSQSDWTPKEIPQNPVLRYKVRQPYTHPVDSNFLVQGLLWWHLNLCKVLHKQTHCECPRHVPKLEALDLGNFLIETRKQRNHVFMRDVWFCAHCVCVYVNIYIYNYFIKMCFTHSTSYRHIFVCIIYIHILKIYMIYRYLWYLCAACIVHIQRPIATNHEDPGVALCRTWYEVGFHRLWADIFRWA